MSTTLACWKRFELQHGQAHALPAKGVDAALLCLSQTGQHVQKLWLLCKASKIQSSPQPDPQLFLTRKYGLPDASSVS